MENKNKNVFRPPPKMRIPKSMRHKSLYCAHHEDFGHLTSECRNLYGQVMHTIRKDGLLQYVKKVNGVPKMVEQPRPSAEHKSKRVVEQRTPSAEQYLRIVPMIAGPILISKGEEKKKK